MLKSETNKRISRAPDIERLVRMRELVTLVGVKPSTIYRLIQQGRFPRPCHPLGDSNISAWRYSEVGQWIADRIAGRPAMARSKKQPPSDGAGGGLDDVRKKATNHLGGFAHADNTLVKYESACRTVSTLTKAKEIRNKAEAMRIYARQAGNHELERDAALVREGATRRLGQLINGRQASGELKQGRPKKHSQGECLSDLGITPKLAMVAQDTADIPEHIFDKLYQDRDPKGIKHERVKLKRKKTHQAIKENAAQRQRPEVIGPVCLISADPPWTFPFYSERGKDATSPDNHYEPMTDKKIGSYLKDEKIEVHKDAALFLWCTASNIFRAIAVMEAWGFTYKSQVVWVKPDTGTGYIFLEQHEVLLYGTRGNMPAPMVIPPSVIFAPRGKKHSAKPLEARAMIEEMFPFFDTATRIELFARGEVPNWTVYGYEALPREEAA